MTSIGIDPGKKGAFAAVANDGRLLGVRDMPVIANEVDPAEVVRIILELLAIEPAAHPADHMIVLEEVAAFPKNGSIGNFKLGKAYGILLGAVAAVQVPYKTVRPTQWKRAMRCSAEKDLSRQRFNERWPTHGDLVRRKLDADRAEAALLAAWHFDQARRFAPTLPMVPPTEPVVVVEDLEPAVGGAFW